MLSLDCFHAVYQLKRYNIFETILTVWWHLLYSTRSIYAGLTAFLCVGNSIVIETKAQRFREANYVAQVAHLILTKPGQMMSSCVKACSEQANYLVSSADWVLNILSRRSLKLYKPHSHFTGLVKKGVECQKENFFVSLVHESSHTKL